MGRDDRALRGLPRGERIGRGVNRENLDALVALLESGAVKVVIDKVYPLSEAADAVAHTLGHHAKGKVAIAV